MVPEAEDIPPTESFLPPSLPSLVHRPNIGIIGRKRTQDFDILSSSDPPLFSSDDLPPSSENYVHKRKKRLYPGTWWGAKASYGTGKEAVRVTRRERKLERAVDSGVWMGSEDTDLSLDDDYKVEPVDVLPIWGPLKRTLEEDRLPAAYRTDTAVFVSRRATECSAKIPYTVDTTEADPEHRADQIIQLCLDESREIVDLSELQLERISPDTLRPLRYLTKAPLGVDHHPSSQEAYSPLTPTLHLYLSRNALRTLPGELFTLNHLTVLSLRNNKLTELPPAIGDLENLVELNIGINKLRWLPWEILKLVKVRLKILNIYPNPFFSIPDRSLDEDASTANATFKAPTSSTAETDTITPQLWRPTFLASTDTTFLHIDGSPVRHTPLPPSTATDSSRLHLHAPQSAHALPPLPTTPSLVPSLLELALRECSRSPYLPHLSDLLPPDSPESISRLLTTACSIKDAGGHKCSVCGREFIVARTEWVEWWDCVPECEGRKGGIDDWWGVPLLRRGCSWSCLPSHL